MDASPYCRSETHGACRAKYDVSTGHAAAGVFESIPNKSNLGYG